MVEVAVVPPVVVVDVQFNGILPSHGTCPLFFPGVGDMHNNIHALQTDRMYSKNSSAS